MLFTMKKPTRRVATAALGVLIAAGAAQATSGYNYKRDEYVVITDGASPNKRYSIVAHGDGDQGEENFQVYLTAEPSHKRLGVFPVVGERNLDTAPDAFVAQWSSNSRYVALYFRQDRRQRETFLFKVRGGRVRATARPDLLKAAQGKTPQDLGADIYVNSSFSEVTWLTPTRFTWTEARVFRSSSASLKSALGEYGQETHASSPDGPYFVEFSAKADCELIGTRVRVGKVSPAAFRVPKFHN